MTIFSFQKLIGISYLLLHKETTPKLSDLKLSDHFIHSQFDGSAIWVGLSWQVLLLMSLGSLMKLQSSTDISRDLWPQSGGPHVSSRIVWAGG